MKKDKKAPEIMQCTASKHIQHAVSMITFAKTKMKICLALRAAVLMRMLLCRTSHAIKTSDVLRAPFYVRRRPVFFPFAL